MFLNMRCDFNIPAAGAVDREFFHYCFYVYSGFEVREVLQKLLGGRGFVLTEYEPVGSHGDPVRVPGHWFWNV